MADGPSRHDEHREWIRAWAAGDSRSGDRLTQALFPVIHELARRRLPEAQEDVVQDTFLRFAANVKDGKYRGDASVRSYVVGIACNVIREQIAARCRARERHFDPGVSSLRDMTGRRLSSLLGERERHQLVLDALEDISLEHHDLLDLRYIVGLTGPELSAALGIPEPTARGRIRTALQQLRRAYAALADSSHALDASEELLARWMRLLGGANDEDENEDEGEP
jgi:RNA polymerase sigma-70 factor (ECF subfamily)